jgi:hypothetical protein
MWLSGILVALPPSAGVRPALFRSDPGDAGPDEFPEFSVAVARVRYGCGTEPKREVNQLAED